MNRRKFIAATCSTLGMSAIGMPALAQRMPVLAQRMPVLAQSKTKIRVGYLHTLAVDEQIWLADHIGAWAKYGLDPQFTEFKTGIELFTAMSKGSIDMLDTASPMLSTTLPICCAPFWLATRLPSMSCPPTRVFKSMN